jgi:hypothetical protein
MALWAGAAEAPPVEPQNTAETRPDTQRRRNEWTRRGAPMLQAGDTVSDEEIKDFMSKHSPERWRRMDGLPPERKEKLMGFIRTQYYWLERLKQEDPEVYALRLKRLPIEDKMFELSWSSRGDAKQSDELREQVKLFLDSSLAERKLRLDRWETKLREQQQTFNREKARLDEALANREEMIDRGVNLVNSQQIGQLKNWAGPMFGHMRAFSDPDNEPATRPSEK